MDTEWLLQRLGNELRLVFPEMTEQQEEDIAHRTRLSIRKWQSLGQARAESKLLTILFSDIRGFTSIAENYPAMRVVDMLNRYLSRMCQIIIHHGGTIDKFMGDSIMVLFGAPVGKEDDVERAIACAVEMQIAMSGVNAQNRKQRMPEIFMGIGINTGSVVAGPLGSELHSEYTVIGDEVNLTSRIEAQSLRGQILISESTYLLARDFVEVGKPNHVHVKGKRDPVRLYELLATHRPGLLQVPRREERKSPRILVEMPFSFQLLDGKHISDRRWHGRVLDLGYYGFLAWTPAYLPPHSEVRVSLATHPLEPATRQCYARVLHCKSDKEGYRVSMEFSSIDDTSLRAIKHFVDSMVHNG